ncbi:MAG TPA: hypothetical protein VNF68_08710 [Candidatus Baltobacteraceae bacterium]|nr:hypothetical protein [Candidatus Baltobacteraceae bacterium]
MKACVLLLAVLVLVLSSPRPARAATGTDLIEAVQSFVSIGLSNADSAFTPLRGASIKVSPGEHYQVNKSFGPFMPDCHISGYPAPAEWVLSCSSPGLNAANVRQLLGLIYQGAIRGMPACFTRTLDPMTLRDETFRWDCHQADKAFSVDVSTQPTSNGDPSFLFEVYEYPGAQPPQPAPAPTSTAVVIQMARPEATLDMGGVQVPYVDYATLNLEMHATLISDKNPAHVHVTEMLKGGNEMPPFDWVWHYAGKQTLNGVQNVVVWICANLSPQEQTAALHRATLLGLLDAGLGGTVLQQAYATANAADTALGPQAPDPFANRRKLIYAMAKYFQ